MMQRRGFTLVETLIAVGLLSAVLMTTAWYVQQVVASRQRLAYRVEQSVICTAMFKRLDEDLATTLVGSSQMGPGIKGSIESIEILSRRLPLASQAGSPASAKLVDLNRSGIRIAASTGTVEMMLGPAGVPPAWSTLGRGIRQLRFRYLDGRRWMESFDSLETGRLPRAIEVSIWFEREQAQDSAPEGRADATVKVDDASPDRRQIISIPDSVGSGGA